MLKTHTQRLVSLTTVFVLLFSVTLSTGAFTGVAVAAGEPVVVITSQPNNPSNLVAPTFEFITDEPADTYCRVDLGAYEICTSPYELSPLTEGAHIFEVYASNGDGDGSVASAAWEIDVTPPDTSIVESPSSPTLDNTPMFTFTSADPGVTFECSVDGATAAACTSPYTTSPLANGPHEFEVYAIDAAGNVDATPAQASFEVETGVNDYEIQMSSAEDGSLINFVENGCSTLGEWETKKESALAVQDTAYAYPVGLVKFQLAGCPIAGTATIQLTFTSNLEPSAVTIRKFNEVTGAFTTLTQQNSGLQVNRTTQEGKQALLVEYEIVDGGLFDQDGEANGQIQDPVGLATQVVGIPNTGIGPGR